MRYLAEYFNLWAQLKHTFSWATGEEQLAKVLFSHVRACVRELKTLAYPALWKRFTDWLDLFAISSTIQAFFLPWQSITTDEYNA